MLRAPSLKASISMTPPLGLKPATAKDSASFALAPRCNLIPTYPQAGEPQPQWGEIQGDQTQPFSPAATLSPTPFRIENSLRLKQASRSPKTSRLTTSFRRFKSPPISKTGPLFPIPPKNHCLKMALPSKLTKSARSLKQHFTG